MLCAVLLTVLAPARSLGAELALGRGEEASRPKIWSFSPEEVLAMWQFRAPRSTAHRHYIYIDEEDIEAEYDLPLFRVEAARLQRLRYLQRMVGDDPGAYRRVSELDSDLARATEYHRRTEDAFYSSRPGVARDVPSTPDVLVGPILRFLSSRR